MEPVGLTFSTFLGNHIETESPYWRNHGCFRSFPAPHLCAPYQNSEHISMAGHTTIRLPAITHTS